MSAFTNQLLAVVGPVLERNGFSRWTPRGKDAGGTFYFRRSVGSRRDLLELQLDKSGRRACFVNLASFDSDAVHTMYDGMVPADEVTTAALSERCRLRGNSTSGMFKPRIWDRVFSSHLVGYRIGLRITAQLPVAESWFAHRAPSSRLKQFRLLA